MAFYHETFHPKIREERSAYIAQEIKAKRGKRRARYVEFGSYLLLALFFVVLFHLQDRLGDHIPTLLFSAVAVHGCVVLWTSFRVPSSPVAPQTKDMIVGPTFERMGWEYSEKASPPKDLATIVDFGLLSHYEEIEFSDRVRGQVGQTEFDLVEYTLKARTRWTASTGIILSVKHHLRLGSVTLGFEGNAPVVLAEGSRLARVRLVSSKWERLFDVYSDDQVEARMALDPEVMERLMDLKRALKGTSLRFGYVDDMLHIVIGAPDLFETDKGADPLASVERMQDLIGEIDAIIALVERVQKFWLTRRNRALPTASPDGKG